MTRDFLRFIRTFVKRLFVEKNPGDSVYRDPVAERLLFTLRVYLSEHPDVDITDLINNEWELKISEAIYENIDTIVQEENDDAAIEAYITNQMFKE